MAAFESNSPPAPEPGDNAANQLGALSWDRGQASDDNWSAFALPRKIDIYNLVERVGEGGMGAVYRAVDPKNNREVAVKLLAAHRLSEKKAVERFDRECKAVRELNHDGVVRAYGFGKADGEYFMAMELVDGVDLMRVCLLRRFAIADACEIARQAALALQYLHEKELVHRDVKPSNLMLNRSGQVKLLDLGLALLRGNTAHDLTTSGHVLGTLEYISPEQLDNSRSVDIRSDIYSLGCTLYHLLAGNPPFAGAGHDGPYKKIVAHTTTPAPGLAVVRPDIPRELNALVARMLAKSPADRPETPAEVAAGLKAFVAGADLLSLLAQVERRFPVVKESWSTVSAIRETIGECERPKLEEPTPIEPKSAKPEPEETVPAAATSVPPRRRFPWGARWGVGAATAAIVGLALCLIAGSLGSQSLAGGNWLATAWALGNDEDKPVELVKRAPEVLDWANPSDCRWWWDSERKGLWIVANDDSMLRFGRTSAENYRISMTFSQSIPGGVGIFWGHHQVTDRPEISARFQAVEVQREGPVPFQGQYLHRYLMATGRPSSWRHDIKRAEVESTLGSHTLTVVVERHRLKEVLWNGVVVPGLDYDRPDFAAEDADSSGSFGIFCEPNSCFVTSVNLTPY